jgi:hypothetical protein
VPGGTQEHISHSLLAFDYGAVTRYGRPFQSAFI